MESIVTFLEYASPRVAKRWEYHRHFNKNMGSLREDLEKLNRRKTDLKRKLETMLIPGETEEVEEVKFWLERVKKIKCEVDGIGDEATRVKFFSRASLGGRIAEMKPQVVKLYEEGGAFAEGSLVRTLPRRGNEKPTVEKLGGQTTTEKTRDEILECLVNDNFTRIGVHGMGGIGKTTVLEHVHNGLLKGDDEIGSKFDKLIWITVSKDCCLTGLQDKIAHKLVLDISKDDDAETRVTKLCREFKKKKRYVLILDDMWEAYPLEKVGIPNPTPENGCKLVLTTRSRDVCTKMECDRIIEMGVLSEHEARDLFLDKVGQNVASNPELHKIVRQVARECAGLPLAIVTVAGSLRDQMDLIEWEDALDDLKDATASMLRDITAILRFSYDRLKDKNHKDCLLYCALYPEDSPIERNLLIDQLTAEAIVEEAKTRQYPARKGHIMLNNLVRNSLLIETKNYSGVKCVKLHDSIRDMAIQIMRESPSRFVAEAGRGPDSLKPEEIWNEHVEKVSLMENEITEISFTEPPKCPRLSTLFLSENRKLERLSEDFFRQMEGLCVLDLSRTAIKTLPESVSMLVNLSVLLVANCRKLVHVPDLSELRKLRRLDLHATGITEVPKGMETMEKLTFLDLSRTELHVTAEDLVHLRKLETLRVNLAKLEDLNAYVRSSNSGKLTNFYLQVGADEPNQPRDNHVRLRNCNINEFPLILPENVEGLGMEKCHFSVQSLCRLISVENISNLVRVDISQCTGLECLFYYASAIFPLLQKIEVLRLSNLDNLCGVFCTEGGALAPLPPGSLSSLKRLKIAYCHNLKKLLVLADASLPNLEEIDIKDCEQLEEIITSNEEADDLTVNNYTVTLPKLKQLTLSYLPKLKSIPFVADSLKSLNIVSCDNLKKLLLLADASLPNLEIIYIHRCEQLEEIITSNEEVDDLTVNNYTVTLPKLKQLQISCCDNLKKLLVLADDCLPNVEEISIEKCEQLEEIITSSNEEADDLTVNNYTVTLPKLKALKLKSLPKLRSIPFVADSLKSLNIISCDNLKKLLVLADASLPNLEDMYISGCEQLEEIITSNEEADDLTVNNYTLTLPKLKQLRLWSLPKLKSIPFVADSLKSLNIGGCDNLKKLLVLADASLPNLEYMDIGNCEQLEEIITSNEEADDLTVNNYTVTLPKLERLRLWELPKLKSIPFVADCLKSLNIIGCDNLKKLLVLADASLPNLEDIWICGSEQLEKIITSNEEADDLTVNNYTVTLPKLKTLMLFDLPKLKSIPFVADSLKSVEIESCPELKSIYFLDGDQCPPSLQSIRIDAEPWKSRYSLSLSRPL